MAIGEVQNREVDKLIAELGDKVGTIYRRVTLKRSSGPYPAGTVLAWCDAGRLEAVPGVEGAYLLTDARRVPDFQ